MKLNNGKKKLKEKDSNTKQKKKTFYTLNR